MISRTLPSTRAAHRLVVRLMGLAIVGWNLGACDAGSPTADAPEPTPTTGALTVGVVTTGTDLGDGYVLSLDGQEQTISPNQSLSFSDLAPGPHVVELRDEDYNCRVMEQPQGPVLITAGETASANFEVECRTKQVAFISGRDGSFDLYLASVSGDEPTHFLSLPQSKEDEPAWSPDGGRLAVATDVGGEFDIYSVDLTGQMENLTRNPGAIEGMPTWSPDGSQLAYRSYRNGNEDIWVMNADGSGQTLIIGGPAQERLPQWSPDGQSIAYVSDEDGSLDIWVLHLPTFDRRRITPMDDIADDWPSWSPDGERIAFASSRDGNTELYVMDADGSNPVNLSQAADSNEWLPAWSPDGKYISFNTDRHGDLDIYWMKADGSRVQPVTTAAGHDFFLTWNPVPWPL